MSSKLPTYLLMTVIACTLGPAVEARTNSPTTDSRSWHDLTPVPSCTVPCYEVFPQLVELYIIDGVLVDENDVPVGDELEVTFPNSSEDPSILRIYVVDGEYLRTSLKVYDGETPIDAEDYVTLILTENMLELTLSDPEVEDLHLELSVAVGHQEDIVPIKPIRIYPAPGGC